MVPGVRRPHRPGLRKTLAHALPGKLARNARLRSEQLLADRVVERLRAAQNVLRLAKSYSPLRLEAACARALAHGSPFYRTVKTILAGGHDLAPPSAAIPDNAAHSGRFARDAASLFAAPATVQ